MKIKGFNSFLNEKVDIDLLAVDMIDYYGNEIPKSSEDSDDFAKSRDLKDRALIKKIWDRAKEIQKEGISEAVSPERMAAKAKKMADAKKSVVNLLDHFSKIVSKENDPEKVEDAFYALETLVNGYVDVMKTAP